MIQIRMIYRNMDDILFLPPLLPHQKRTKWIIWLLPLLKALYKRADWLWPLKNALGSISE